MLVDQKDMLLMFDEKTDDAICYNSGLLFAKVCVEIDFDSELLALLFPEIEGFGAISCKYPWKPQKYEHCREFGHTKNICSKIVCQVYMINLVGSGDMGSFSGTLVGVQQDSTFVLPVKECSPNPLVAAGASSVEVEHGSSLVLPANRVSSQGPSSSFLR